MASAYYDQGLQDLTSGGAVVWASDDIRVLLMQAGAVHDVTDTTITLVLAGGGDNEVSVASYARQALTGEAKNFDSGSQEVRFDSDDPAFGALESGETVESAVVFEFVTNDGDSRPLFWSDDISDLILNGGTVTITVPATGWAIINGG